MHNSSPCSSHYTAYTHTPAEMALHGIHLQTRTPYGAAHAAFSYATRQPARTQGRERCCALIEPCTLAQERLLPNPLSVQRRSNKSWWRTQPSCRTRTQHLRCATLTGSMWFSCMPAAQMVLYGIHLQTRTPYARSPSSCARAQRQVRLALRVWLPETDLLELSYLPETTLFEIR